jgi:hypothetical protein
MTGGIDDMDASFTYDDARGVYDWVDDPREAAAARREFGIARGVFLAVLFSVPLWAAVIGLVVAIVN